MIKVADIRHNNMKITKKPIIYRWWFRANCLSQLLHLLHDEIDYNKITYQRIHDECYALLYIGRCKNGHHRLIEYHILDKQNFHEKGVKNGRLSSLRQTLCGLLQLPMSCSKELINEFMDKNCVVDFEPCNLENLNRLEHERISKYYLPLNYQNTKNILTSGHRKTLKECKKCVRQ